MNSHFKRLVALLFGGFLLIACSASAAVVTATFNTATNVPVTAASYTATGNTVDLELNFAPETGASLTVVKNTGVNFIQGAFENLAQGQRIDLKYNGIRYPFVADYFGGTGNDLVLQWAYTKIYAWGDNTYGPYGRGNNLSEQLPTAVGPAGILAGKTVTALGVGSSHTLALCANGTLAAWGGGGSGQLGNDSTTISYVPLAITTTGVLAGKRVVAIAVSGDHNLVLCSDGTMASWGSNVLGELGNGNTANSRVPVAVANDGVLAGKSVMAIAAGPSYCLALCSDGTLAAWGNNTNGQLGNGSTTSSKVPVAVVRTGVLASKTVTGIAAGACSMALCSDGTIASWGSGWKGNLGNGGTANSSVPVSASSGALAGRYVTAIVAGYNSNLALCQDRTLVAWGYSGSGGLGNGTYTDSSVPVVVSATGVLAGKVPIAIAASYPCYVLCTDGTIAAWGDNQRYQYGDGTSTTSNVPVATSRTKLGGGEKFTSLALGSTAAHTMAIAAVPLSGNSQLSGLAMDGAVLDPVFDATTVAYTARVKSGTSALTVTPTAADGAAAITVNGTAVASGAASGTISATPGSTIVVRVTAENGNITTYGLTVRRDATLASLGLSRGSLLPVFSPFLKNYSASVGAATDSLVVTPVAADPTSAVKVNSMSAVAGGVTIPLVQGGNPVSVTVTALDGTVVNYQLTVTRAAPVNFTYTSGTSVPLTVSAYVATGNTVNLALGFAPTVGNSLNVANNTGLDPIIGRFANLAQGQSLSLVYNGARYQFVANYYGGTGNDLVLEWADTAAYGWGDNTNGQVGDGMKRNLTIAVPLAASAALTGKTIISLAGGGQHSLALCSDGTLASWGSNEQGQLGTGDNEQRLVPTVITDAGVLAGRRVVAIAAGENHSLALCDDGTIAAWGANSAGQLGNGLVYPSNVPVKVILTGALSGKTVTAIDAGSSHSMALCSDGTVLTWGSNSFGQLGNGTTASSIAPVKVIATGALLGKTVTAIGAGRNHCIVRCSDGTLAAWGNNSDHQLGNTTTTDSSVPVAIPQTGVFSGRSVQAIAAGGVHNLAICSDGKLVSWGSSSNGVLGNGEYSAVPVLVSNSGVLAGKAVTEISAGSDYSLALCSDGTFAMWGYDFSFQGGTPYNTTPVAVDTSALGAGEKVVGISKGATAQHVQMVSALPVSANSALAGLGLGTGVLDPAFSAGITSYTARVPHGTDSITVTPTAANAHAVIEVNGNPLASGTASALIPLSPGNMTFTVKVTAQNGISSTTYTITVKDDSTLSGLALGSGTLVPAFAPGTISYTAHVSTATSELVLSPTVSEGTATITLNGVAVVSGSPAMPVSLAMGGNLITLRVTALDGTVTTYTVNVIRQVPVTYAFSSSSGTAATSSGYTASGNTANLSLNFAPVAGTSLRVVNNTGQAPITGVFDNLAQGQHVDLTYNGVTYPFVANYFGGTGNDLVLQWANLRLLAWGNNGDSQLGDGTTNSSNTPVAVRMTGALEGKIILSTVSGANHNLALCSDGTVAAWGYNYYGQLGDNQNASSGVPVKVLGLPNQPVVAIAAGANHSLALMADGSVYAWGSNQSGQLGSETVGGSVSRVAVRVNDTGVLAGKTVTAIAGGLDFSLSLCSDGSLVTWGGNGNGQLGNKSPTNSTQPVLVHRAGVLAGKTVSAIAAGGESAWGSFALALCTDGNLASWGSNDSGQLGNNGSTDSNVPVLVIRSGVLAGKMITAVAAGGRFSTALCSDSTLAGWGDGGNGQIGTGNYVYQKRTPVLVNRTGVLAGKTINAIATGSQHTLALGSDGSLAAWGYNDNGQLGIGSNSLSLAPASVGLGSLRSGERLVGVQGGLGHSLALVASPPPPAVTTLAVSSVLETTVTLNGRVSAAGTNSAVTFEYGTTTAYGNTVTATPAEITGIAATGVSASVGGLTPGTIYHYRVLASSANGTAPGGDLTFVTTDLAGLSGLALSAGALEPAFNRSVVRYLATVPFSADNLTVTPSSADPGSTVMINGMSVSSGGSSPVNLPVGNTTLNVIVTSPGGAATRTYTVTVTRLPENFVFNSSTDVPVNVADFSAAGNAPAFVLNHTPLPGTSLTVVSNTGSNPITGTFDNLTQGQIVYLTHGGVSFPFVADYFGGTGNDLVLRWATTRVLAWGKVYSSSGQELKGGYINSLGPVPVDRSGVLAGKAVVSVASGSSHSLAICADGTLAAWGYNSSGQLGTNAGGTGEPVLVDRSGVLADKTVIRIAAGYEHSLALCSDGTLVAWGRNSRGQLGTNGIGSGAAPRLVDLSGVLAGKTITAIVASSQSSFVLCADGSVAAWGYNEFGQLGDGTSVDRNAPVLVNRSGPLDGKTIKAIAAGGSHTVALCADGTVVSWGRNEFGQLGDNSTTDSKIPVLVNRAGVLAGKTITAISPGYGYTTCLCADGTLAAWGSNNYGQLGNGSTSNSSVPVKVNQTGVLAGKTVVALKGGSNGTRTCTLSTDGTLAAWGSGPLGDNRTSNSSVPLLVDLTGLNAGERVVSVETWGYGLALVASPPPPVAIAIEPTDLADTSATLNATVNASGTDSTVTFEYGLSPDYGTTVATVPITVTGAVATPVRALISGLIPGTTYHFRVVASNGISIARSEDATFTTTGVTTLADLTLSAGPLMPGFSKTRPVYAVTVPFSTGTTTLTPIVATPGATVTVNGAPVESGASSNPIPLAEGVNSVAIVVTSPDGSINRTYTVNVTRLPETIAFNSGDDIPLTVTDMMLPEASMGLSLNFAPAVGSTLTIVRNTGLNLIQGTFANLAQGQAVTLNFGGVSYPFVVNYFGGSGNDLVLQWAGIRVVAWGSNGSGVIGNGSTVSSSVPVPTSMGGVLLGKTVVAVAPSSAHNLVLCSDGTLVAWGSNGSGRLGNGSTTASNEPVLVNQTGVLAGKTVIAIATGSDFNLVLCADGTMASWGANGSGQLGEGSTTARDVPVRVDQTGVLAGKKIIAIAAGDSHSLALCADGTLATWGYNAYGQLGNVSNANSALPVLVNQDGVLKGKTIAAIAVGSIHSLALCADGTLAAWGRNSDGQLGNGTTIDSNLPKLVNQDGALNGKTVAAIAGAKAHSLALCTDGTLAAWGKNDKGQLGNGSTTNSAVPVQVMQTGVLTGKTVEAISARESQNFALCSDGTLAAWGSNYNAQLGDNTKIDRNTPVLVESTGLRTGERFAAVEAGQNHSVALVATPPSPLATTLAATEITDERATLHGTANAQESETKMVFEYGATTDYGSLIVATPATATGTNDTAATSMLQGLDPGRMYHYRMVATNAGGSVAGEDMTFTTTTMATLSDLTLSDGSLVPAFNPAVRSYALTVPNEVTGINVMPIAAHQGATISVNGNPLESGATSGQLSLAVGENRIEVQVTSAGGGNSLTYGVTVLRLPTAFAFNSLTDLPLSVDGLVAVGDAPPFELNFAPVPGTRLTVVNNEGAGPIQSRFDNLAQGQLVQLSYNGISYPFVVSYFGGTGNDLVLQWANTRMVAWGYNGTGELGNGGSTNSTLPVSVVMDGVLAGKTVVAVTAGTASASALCADGTVAAWGSSSNGALGNGTGLSSSVPMLVDSTGVLAGKFVVSLASGRAHTLALCADGTLVAWGYNASGQLGDGSTTDRNAPVLVDRKGALKNKTVSSIAVSSDSCMVLCSDGTLATWGSNVSSQLGTVSNANSSVPVAVDQTGVLAGRKVTSISSTGGHCLVLCSDGSLVAWGYNGRGEFGNGTTTSSSTPILVPPSGVLIGKTISQIVAGSGWSMALCTDGTIAAWGYNSDGELGNNSYTNSSIPVAVVQTGVLSGKTVVGLFAGSRGTSLALCSDGTLAAWSVNNYGQFGNDVGTKSNVPVVAGIGGLLAGENYMDIAAGYNSTHTLVAMPPPPTATTLAATAVTDSQATLNGSVNAQGSRATVWFEYGTTTAYGMTATAIPASASGSVATLTSAAIGGLTSGTTYHFRVVASGQRGEDMTFTTSSQATLSGLALSDGLLSPAFASSITDYTATVSNAVSSITLTPSASLPTATLKVNGTAQLSATPSAPISLQLGENTIHISVDAGDGLNMADYTVKVVRLPETFVFNGPGDVPLSVSALTPNGLPISVILNYVPIPGTNLTLVENTGPNPIRGEFAGIAEGQRVLLMHGGIAYDFIASYTGGTGNDLVLYWANVRLLGWGSATNGGALGGTVPTPFANEGALAGKVITAISTGGSHGLARCSDGTVVTWGANDYGQLGAGSAVSGVIPVAVDRSGVLAGKVVVAVSTGGSSDLALCSDGTLVSWGNNNNGTLGAGSFASKSYLPVRVDQSGVLAGKTPVAIATGGNQSLVLCSDGTLASWGQGGTLGNGSAAGSPVPVLVNRSGVLAGKTPVAIAAGGGHCLVLCADGTIAAWGVNSYGQLGNGATVSALTPVLVDQSGVLAGKKVTAIAAGSSHSLAFCADGTMVAWGYNYNGQLGDFSTTTRTTPVEVNAQGPLFGRRVISIAAGGEQSIALCEDGTMLAWGDNAYSQLGTGNQLDSPVPVTVAAGAIGFGERTVAISAGYYYSAALVASPPSPVIETLAADNILDTGATLRGSVNANGMDVAISFEYGLTTAYGSTVNASPAVASGISLVSTNALVSGFEPGLTYHYRVVATRSERVTRGEDRTFTTTTLSALTDLRLSHGILSPAFSMIERNYIATVPDAIASLTVTPVAATSGATIRVAGAVVASGVASNAIAMAHGENTVEITVTSPDGAQTRTYTVTVTRLPAKFVFHSPTDVPLTVGAFVATGNIVEFELDHEPVPGARLMVVRNTGTNPIYGRFSNLQQGQFVYLIHDGQSYLYVADYFGGTGNDLVLHWANNRLMAFGYNQSGQLGDGSVTSRSVPVAVTDSGVLDGKVVIDIKCGTNHTVALCSDGTVATWGDNSNGQLGRTGSSSNVPVAVDQTGVLAGKRVVAISSGGWHTFALCDDGTLVGWGSNGSLQLGDIGVTSTSVPVIIPMNGAIAGRKVTAIAAGGVHSLALCSDGTLAGWGYSGDGQVGDGTNSWVRTPTLVSRSGILAGKTVVTITAGEYFSLALCSDGTLASWGKNDVGQLGTGRGESSLVPLKVDQTGVLAGKSVDMIRSGAANSIVLCSDGTIASWGYGTNGSLGNGMTVNSQVPVAVDRSGPLAGKNVVGISTAGGHSFAIGDDGSLAAWGFNFYGQLGDGTVVNRSVPVQVVTTSLQQGERFIAAICGNMHTLAIVASPQPPPPPLVVAISASEITGTSVTLHGSVNARKNLTTISFDYGLDESFGTNRPASPGEVFGKLDTAVSATLTGLKPGTTYRFRVVASGFGDTVSSEEMTFTTLSDNAKLAGLGNDGGVTAPAIDGSKTEYFSSVPFETTAVSVTALTAHPAATMTINGTPVARGSASNPTALAVGDNVISVFVTAEDRITTIAYTLTVNRLPQEFVFNSERDIPVTANGFTAGGNPVIVRLNFAPVPGTILTMVNNTQLGFIYGRFGNIAQGQRVSLAFGGKVYDFVANYFGGTGNDLVLQWADTELAGWGNNNYGQLGDGGTVRRLLPTGVDATGVLAGKTIVAVSTGYLHSLALCSDGTLASWGYNVYGQLGDGGNGASSVPVEVDRSGVLASKTIIAISAGPFHNLALCSDGSIIAWGYNNYGQLGTGDKVTRRTPTLVVPAGALAGKQVVGIAAGAYDSFARCADGSVVGWGYNDEGELGDNSTISRLIPVAVDITAALANKMVASISAGQYHTLALCTDGTLVAWGYNQHGELGNNTVISSQVPVAINSFGALAGRTVSSVTAGGSHNLALCTDGTLAAWGANGKSQLGVSGNGQRTVPVTIGSAGAISGKAISKITAAANHSMALCSDGSLAAWGDNSSGQLGNNTPATIEVPTLVDAANLPAGSRFMLAATGNAALHNLAIVGLPQSSTPSGIQPSEPLGDQNHNGIPNLIERAFALDPTKDNSANLPLPQRIGDHYVIEFTEPENLTSITYGAESSVNLKQGSWVDIPDTGSGPHHIFSVPAADGKSIFFRLKISE